jgi:sugar phosphate isomerase/epimerase
MFKNLSPNGLGISGRQSELIELALTYGFRGLDIDMEHFVKQAQRRSMDHARRFIDSAKAFAGGCSIGSWKLTTRWLGDEASYRADLTRLGEIAEIAGKIGATRATVLIEPASDTQAFTQNFEMHRTRLGQMGDVLKPHGVKLGLDFSPMASRREGKAHEFIKDFEGLLTLIKTVNNPQIGLLLDTFNWYVGGGTMEQLRGLKGEQIVAVRIADVPGSSTDKSQITEKQRVLPKPDGLVDTDAIGKLLVEKGYNGPVTPYPHPRNFLGKTREVIVQQAAEAMENLWVACGLSQGKPERGVLVGASVNGEVDDEIEMDLEGEAEV